MDDLAGRLLRAAIVEREQLHRALRLAPRHGSALIETLVDEGLAEEQLVAFFVEEGLGPPLEADDLQPSLSRLLPEDIARSLLALPLYETARGVVVAMAAPSDWASVRMLQDALGCMVLPVVAPLRTLQRAIREAYGDWEDETGASALDTCEAEATTFDASESEPREFHELSSDSGSYIHADPYVEVGSGNTYSPFTPSTSSAPPPNAFELQDSTDLVVSFALEADSDERATLIQAAGSSPPERDTILDPGLATEIERAQAPRPTSVIPKEHETWEIGTASSLAPAFPPIRLRPSEPSRARADLPLPPPTLSDIGSTLDAIKGSHERDPIIRLTCEGAVTVCRAAVFFALHEGVLRGWDGIGGGISRDSARNLWIPLSSPSMFQNAIASGDAYYGPYGTGLVDGLFRAAVSSRGSDVLIQPAILGRRVIGLLCADELLSEDLAKARIEALVHLAATALGRALAQRKVSR